MSDPGLNPGPEKNPMEGFYWVNFQNLNKFNVTSHGTSITVLSITDIFLILIIVL